MLLGRSSPGRRPATSFRGKANALTLSLSPTPPRSFSPTHFFVRFIRSTIIDTGICHFMLIVKEPSGALRQYDFGPRGGDVTFGDREGSWGQGETFGSCPLTQRQQEPSASAGEDKIEWKHSAEEGEVRETILESLPTHLPLLLVGAAREGITTEGIREFSKRCPLHYKLCERDCRHFTNDLYHFICGEDTIVTSQFIRAQFHQKIEHHRIPIIKHLVHRPLIELIQHLTAQENWEKTKRGMEAFKTSLTATVCGIGLHLAVQPLHSAPMAAMAMAAVATSTSTLLSSSESQTEAIAPRERRKNEAQGGRGVGFLGAAQAIGFGALTVASAALTASMGSRALALPANAAIEVGRRVGRIASSPQALSTFNNLRRAVQRKDGMRKVASAGVLMLPGLEPSSREGRSREGSVRFKARGGSPEGRALLFPSPTIDQEGSPNSNHDLLSPPVLSFTSDCIGKRRKQGGSDWSMSRQDGSRGASPMLSFGAKRKGVSSSPSAARGALMVVVAPERNLIGLTAS